MILSFKLISSNYMSQKQLVTMNLLTQGTQNNTEFQMKMFRSVIQIT